MVQIPKLKPNLQSRIESVLDIFSQTYKTNDEHKLNYIPISADPLTNRIMDRLTRAIADDMMRKKMDLEDEVNQIFQEADDKAAEAETKTLKVVAKLKKVAAEAEKNKAEAARYKQSASEKDEELAALKALIEEMKKKT
jgi:uncharacterized membrane protein (UPF0182 family)